MIKKFIIKEFVDGKEFDKQVSEREFDEWKQSKKIREEGTTQIIEDLKLNLVSIEEDFEQNSLICERLNKCPLILNIKGNEECIEKIREEFKDRI